MNRQRQKQPDNLDLRRNVLESTAKNKLFEMRKQKVVDHYIETQQKENKKKCKLINRRNKLVR